MILMEARLLLAFEGDEDVAPAQIAVAFEAACTAVEMLLGDDTCAGILLLEPSAETAEMVLALQDDDTTEETE